jgi:hypothetical protein
MWLLPDQAAKAMRLTDEARAGNRSIVWCQIRFRKALS